MADSSIQMPAFGGLTRYKEEYDSKLKISPAVVVGLIIATIIAVIVLNLVWPIGG